MTRAHATSIALLFWTVVSLPAAAHAQTRPVEPGDLVRLDRLVDGAFEKGWTGRLESISEDTLFVRVVQTGRDSVMALGRDRLDTDLRLNLYSGTHALKGAVTVGGTLASLGFSLGYCFQLFADGCAGDLEGGLAVGALFGLAGAAVGGLIGAAIPNYTPVGASALYADARVTPLLSSDGKVGVSVSVPLAGR
jgi:hypothetical protein